VAHLFAPHGSFWAVIDYFSSKYQVLMLFEERNNRLPAHAELSGNSAF